MLLIAAALAPAAATTTAVRPARIHAELIASTVAPQPGTTIILGIRMTPEPGWHSYWSNPGESGLAPTVSWVAPPGIQFGRLQHPAPTLLKSMGVESYVHSGPHVLVSRMTVSPRIKAGTPIPVSADLTWAACSENQCVPEHARLSLRMVAGDGAKSSDAPALSQAVRALPRPGSSGTFATRDGQVTLQLPEELHLNPRRARFFPDANGYFDATKAHGVGSLPLTIDAPETGKLPDRIAGVVSDGSTAYRLSFHRVEMPVSPQRDKLAPSQPPQRKGVQAAAPATDTAPSAAAVEQHPTARGLPWLVRALVLLGLLAFGASAFALAKRP